MISGCKPENCHYKEGNLSARRQLVEFQAFLGHIGFQTDRIRFSWIDLQDRGRIQKEIAEFDADLRLMAPSEHLVTRRIGMEGGLRD